MGLLLFLSALSGIAVEALVTAAPAAAATATYTCTTPASGGTSVTWYAGVNNTQNIVCYGVSGVSGTAAYPASITLNTGSLPPGATEATSTTSTPPCTQSTSGSGTTEEYLLTCPIALNPPTTLVGNTYPMTFTANPGTDGGSATNSGTDTLTVANPTQACSTPASGGSSATFVQGYANSVSIACYVQTNVSGQALYPSSIHIVSGAFPADANEAFSTSTSSTPPCTQSTSGSGTSEHYILTCPLTATPSPADAGTYPFTFQPTANGVTGPVSGTETITVGPPTITCTAPASGGTATTFFSSAGGTNNSYSVSCYGVSGVSGLAAYPTSIAPNGTLPADAVVATSTANGCTQSTSGSGTTEHYILTCPVTEDAVATDNGVYTSTFTATDSHSGATATSGTWTLTVTGPTTTCTAPAAGGTSTTFNAGLANTYSVSCYSTGFASADPGNYPSSITVASGSLPADASEATSTTSSPACTQSTSGSGPSEEYILTCPITETPTAGDVGSYPVTFSATPGVNGGNTVTTGTWNLTVAPVPITCTAPASGGTGVTFYTGTSNSYSVACYGVSGVSGEAAYPSSMAIATGSLPSDGNPTFATSTSSSPACTQSTSGSGTTEHWILTCNLADTPVLADAGTYPLTFTANGPGGIGSATTGTLTVTVQPPTTTCSAPASGGTSTTFTDGSAGSYTVTCYTVGFASASSGNYPASINIASGSLPADASFATSLSSTPACTTGTSGSGTSEQYQLKCNITETPVTADNGVYHLTFVATPGSNGGTSPVSGTLTLTVAQPAPTWTSGQYFSAIKNVPFCEDVSVSNAGALPLTSITAGATPSGFTNYHVQNVNLAVGTAQVCGTDTNTPATSGTPPAMAPVATNSGGSATDSIPTGSQNECTWTAGGSGENTTVSMFDPNQDLEQAGSQSAFGQPITNGEDAGTSTNYATCTGDVMVAASGGLGDAWTVNTANPLPTPVDTNPSAAQGDLPSSNLELGKGCYGSVNILSSYSYTSFGSGSILTVPSPWVNGGDCAYGTLGSNSAGGNTDTTNATCPPSQADVNEGYVDCTVIASSGNDENGSVNYSSLDVLFNGQPVPQTPTATLSAATAGSGGTVSVTGGQNWWGNAAGAPSSGPFGDWQNGAGSYYPVGAPSVYIGTSRATAVPVLNSTVTIPANQYVCTGAESTTVGPNPCTMTPGQPTGSFTLPSGLAPGQYNIYIDETNTTPLPGNGPNDAFQVQQGTNLGTAESVTPIDIEGVMVVKTSTTSGYGAAGDVINYQYQVTNTGPDPITGIIVNDNLIPSADISCPDSSLAANASETCTGSYTATQTDVDNGSVTNTATVSATGPDDEPVTSAPSSATVDASDATSSLSLTKSTTSTGYGATGDTIPYSYLVTNTGTTTLTGIAVNDNLVPDVSCPDSMLAPGASETCSGSYTVTQADVDNGSVTNTATATGTTLQSSAVSSAPSSVTVPASNATSSLNLVKSSSSAGYSGAGDSIPYSYVVTNTGTTTLSGIAVNDNLVPDVSCPDSSLAPEASETCTGSYTVTQADVDNGSVTNTATAGATNPADSPVTSNSSSVTVDRTLFTILKSTTSTGYGAAGDTIDYQYLLTNGTPGGLSGISVSDNLVPDVSCPDSSLGSGQSETCTGSYTVTQADVDNGSVTNTASASATDSQNVLVTTGLSSVTVLASNATSSLTLSKSTTSSGYGRAGDTIDYQYLVTNTGTTTLAAVGVSDNLVNAVDCPQPSLAPAASETCTGSYTVTQADVDSGSVTNTAQASATSPSSVTVDSSTSTVTVLASQATSALGLTSTANPTTYTQAGQSISYSDKVTNTGTTTLSSVSVGNSLLGPVSCPQPTLAPAASETCTGSYTVTQADVDNGSVSNTAQATAITPVSNGSVSSNTAAVTVSYSGLRITTASLPTLTLGTPYSVHLTATGGTAPYTWAIVAGGLKGLSLTASGLLKGTVTKKKAVPGTYTIAVKVTDSKKGKPKDEYVSFLQLQVVY